MSNLPAVPKTATKTSLWKRIKSASNKEREASQRSTKMLVSLATAAGGGYLFGKFPEYQRLFDSGANEGIDSRYVVGIAVLGGTMMKVLPPMAQEVAEVLLTTALWDSAKVKGEESLAATP